MTPEEAKQAWKKKAYEQNELAGRHLYYFGIEAFKSALREEIEKMQNECTDDLEYKVLDQLKAKLDTITPKQ